MENCRPVNNTTAMMLNFNILKVAYIPFFGENQLILMNDSESGLVFTLYSHSSRINKTLVHN